jgi:RimJ/RimL family protein N-acetyltransferase
MTAGFTVVTSTITIEQADPHPESRDSKLIWEWRNDPLTRQMSRTTDPIAWETHAAWYAGTDSRILMAFVDGEPAAMLRFDLIEPDHAEININLKPEVRGKGLGEPILVAGCTYGFDTLGLVRIRAEVKPENLASIKIFERAGFVPEGDHDGRCRYRRERG